MERHEITSYLRTVPDEIERVCAGLSDEQLRRRPSPNDWSVLELVCHLRDSAQEEGTRVRRLVEEEHPTLVPYDQDAWAVERDYRGQDPRKVLTALRAFFSGFAYQLEGLTDEQWQRAGTHPEIGRVTVHRCA
ncbi:MAG: DinB family protein, partial [bacterium]